MPAISVIMSVYNSEAWLKEAIESVLAQSFTDFEFIIIDDGSKDRSDEIIKSYRDPRIVFIQQDNFGLAAALNRGISLAKSDLIARMDADDISMPERLEIQYNFMQQHPEIVALGSAAIYIDENGQTVAPVYMPENHRDILAWLPESPVIHPSVIFRKDAFYKAGQYPLEFICAQDAVLFNRMTKVGYLHNLRQPLLKYRIARTALSRRTESQRLLLRQIIERFIKNGKATEDDTKALADLRSKGTSAQKSFSYHFFLAKLHLWNGNSVESRRNLSAARKFTDTLRPVLPTFVLALLPPKLTKILKYLFDSYKKLKSR